MAITYPLSLPANKSAYRVTLALQSAVTISESPTTFVSQTQAFSGQRWILGWNCPLMTRDEAEEWSTFLLKLNGMQGTFLAGDPAAKTPRGIATGTPQVQGAHQKGQELKTSGWTPSKTGILKAGDYIQIGVRLYKVLSDAHSDSSGHADIDIVPRLRESPANHSSIITSNCLGLFRLAENQSIFADISTAKHYTISFNAVEAI